MSCLLTWQTIPLGQFFFPIRLLKINCAFCGLTLITPFPFSKRKKNTKYLMKSVSYLSIKWFILFYFFIILSSFVPFENVQYAQFFFFWIAFNMYGVLMICHDRSSATGHHQWMNLKNWAISPSTTYKKMIFNYKLGPVLKLFPFSFWLANQAPYELGGHWSQNDLLPSWFV